MTDYRNYNDLFSELQETPSCITSVAGMQFYDYDGHDDLVGNIKPKPGDRLQLVRRPENRADANAVEVWYRDGRFQIGHLPKIVASYAAQDLDAGKSLRCYCADGGDGDAWSMTVVLFHEDLHPELQKKQFERNLSDLERHFSDYDEETPYSPDSFVKSYIKTTAHKDQSKRRQQAAEAFVDLLIEPEDYSRAIPLPKQPPKSMRSKTFGWWDEIPTNVGLKTKTQWSDIGYNIKKRVRKPFAHISYRTRRDDKEYDLYASNQVEPKKLKSHKQVRATLLRTLR
ncbi:HIRAN domain-containing protein [Sulfitobacter sp. PM12]|uniref:HIRAN domain-containing protein n=1 Tax=Sulfitobacter sp. PM12 TaxID=3138497 RepID=UPI00388F2795